MEEQKREGETKRDLLNTFEHETKAKDDVEIKYKKLSKYQIIILHCFVLM